MLSFFFIQMLALSAFARYSIFNEVIKDPVSFAQTFSQVNPDQVKEIIHIVEGLIADGQQKKNDIINTHEASVTVLDGATKDLGNALWVFETARGERLEADIEVARLEAVLKTKQDEERAAADDKDIATDDLKDAQDHMDAEVSRVDDEKAIFETVIGILQNLPESLIEDKIELPALSSHLAPIVPAPIVPAPPIVAALIQAAKADPQAVAKVIQLVEDLIAAGEEVRRTVTAARDQSKEDLDKATEFWQTKVDATVVAKEALADANDIAAKKLVAEKDLQAKWEKATAVHAAAEKDEAEKRTIRETEVPILDSENESLVKVIGILQGLL